MVIPTSKHQQDWQKYDACCAEGSDLQTGLQNMNRVENVQTTVGKLHCLGEPADRMTITTGHSGLEQGSGQS